MTTTYRDAQYTFSHGAKPRGFGYWIFELVGFDATGRRWKVQHNEPQANYGEAKKRALKKARDMGAHSVEVLP